LIPLPDPFRERLLQQVKDAVDLLKSLQEEAPTSVRLNPSKPTSRFANEERVVWCPHGRYLPARPSFTLDPLFHAGAYYPQEAGSMAIDFALQQLELPTSPLFLDLCAAPGGKSSLLLDFLAHDGFVVSNEIIRNRALILRENLTKWGYTNSIVTSNSPDELAELSGLFDLILIDAPCSGEGMFRKDPQARTEWTPQNAENCVIRQQEILADSWPLLKENGYLLYSTCTFNPKENENQLEAFLEEYHAEIVHLNPPKEWKLTADKNGFGWYCYPHITKSEGFYFAALRKKEPASGRKRKDSAKKKTTKSPEIPSELKELSEKSVELFFHKDFWYALPEGYLELAQFIQHHTRILKMGTRLGQQVGKTFVPDHEWALAQQLTIPYPVVEVDASHAIKYLKGDTFTVDAPTGWVSLTHEGLRLGWIKNLGNRMNNYYPKEYRIRMAID
jgi:16S rRNA C967 or C1407 C5-methylase (RsmB/RsmF family)/NOL1/NOP2/fmu family ribosome biogenesis protein